MKRRLPWILCGLGLALLGLAFVVPAGAQTAADINRMNQAMQICASPAGAAIAECAQLGGQLGAGAYGDSSLATAQAAQAYRACVAANPNNYARCQAALAASSSPGASVVQQMQQRQQQQADRPPPAPVDPLAGVLGGRP